MRDAARPVLVGLGAGLIAAVAVARLMSSLLVGVGPGDPLVLALTTARWRWPLSRRPGGPRRAWRGLIPPLRYVTSVGHGGH